MSTIWFGRMLEQYLVFCIFFCLSIFLTFFPLRIRFLYSILITIDLLHPGTFIFKLVSFTACLLIVVSWLVIRFRYLLRCRLGFSLIMLFVLQLFSTNNFLSVFVSSNFLRLRKKYFPIYVGFADSSKNERILILYEHKLKSNSTQSQAYFPLVWLFFFSFAY